MSRRVRCDQMPRVRGFERMNPPTFLSIAAPTFNQLQLGCMQNCLSRVRTHVINVSRTEHCERQGPPGQGSNSAVGRSMPTSTDPPSSGSGQSGARGLGGMLGKRTVAVLRQKGERTLRTVALRSRLEMSVMEARFWCSQWIALSIFVCAACVA